VAQLVRVTRHALEQHAARWPNGLTVYERTAQMESDALAGLLAGRASKKEPGWSPHGREKTRRQRKRRREHWERQEPTMRYVWTEERERLYLVDQRLGRIIVVSALPGAGDTAQPDG
jgi:hypothetical protein